MASDLINQGAVNYRVEQKKIVEGNTDEIYLLITFQSDEKLQSIKYLGKDKEKQADPFEIYGNGNSKISIDYKVEATQNYYFEVTTEAGNTEEIVINEIVKYVLSYDLNGVTGNIDSEIYTKGQKLNVTSEILLREYYEFDGWNTNPDGTGENYSSGSEIELKNNTILYAHWIPWLHTISYNANGGTGAPENQIKTTGQQLYLSSTKPTRAGYNFIKWTTESNGSGDSYLAGSEYTIDKKDETVTLYAQWECTSKIQTSIYYAYPTNIEIYNVEYGNDYIYFNVTTKSGYDKINIPIYGLVEGHSYTISFTRDYTGNFNGNTNFGCKISNSIITGSNKPISQLSFNNKSKEIVNGSINFTASSSTMYWAWDLSALRDDRVYKYIKLYNIKVVMN